jgi:hypothetical protein
LHGKSQSLRQIAEALEEVGHKPRRADRWHAESVRRIIAAWSGPRAGGCTPTADGEKARVAIRLVFMGGE